MRRIHTVDCKHTRIPNLQTSCSLMSWPENWMELVLRQTASAQVIDLLIELFVFVYMYSSFLFQMQCKKYERPGMFLTRNVCKDLATLGFIPSTDLVRNSGAAQKFFARYILHGMLRFTKMTRTVQQGSQAICNVASDEKLKGRVIKTISLPADLPSVFL